MSVKTIFQQGRQEQQRRKAIAKEKRTLQQKQAASAKQLTALGAKAWSAKIDLAAHGDSQPVLTGLQTRLDELQARSADLQQRRQLAEEKKKRESERLTAARGEVEAKKKDVDKRIRAEQEVLTAQQREMDRANDRLGKIPREREQLQARAAAPATPEAEREGLRAQVAALAGEEAELQGRVREAGASVGRQGESIAPLQQEAAQLQKRIDDIRAEQAQTIAALDRELAVIRTESDECAAKRKETVAGQDAAFGLLGERLAAAGCAEAAVAAEMAAVRAARDEVAGVQAQMQSLDGQQSAAGARAYRQMMAILTGAALAVVALVAVLVVVLSPRKPRSPFEALVQPGGGGQADLQRAVQQMAEGFGGVRRESERQHGGTIVLADQARLAAVLPAPDGWQMAVPDYSRGAFGELQTAHLSAAYTAGDGRRVDVEVTDSGTAAALLAPVKMVFALNLSVDNDSVTQRVSTRNGVAMAERFDKSSRESSFSFIVKDRYLIELRTRAEGGLDLLREFVARMDLDRLP